MHPADKALLRLALGVGLTVAVAYGLSLPAPFVSCIMAVVFLAKPGPPMPFAKGLVVGLVVFCLLIVGILMVPLLRHYRLSGLLITATLLYLVFFSGARKANPLTTILVVAFTVIPVAGVLEQALATALAQAIGVGMAVGVAVSGVSHALFPDPRSQAPPAPAGASPEAAKWLALQATIVVMPVFMVALTYPPLYLAAIMKTVALGQQAGEAKAGAAGRELVGSTLMGGLMAAAVWGGLTMLPNLWMLTLWITAACFWGGARLYRIKPTSVAPTFWLNALITMFIVLGPGIEDAAAGKDVYLASATRVSLFVLVSLYAWATVWALGRWRASRMAALPAP